MDKEKKVLLISNQKNFTAILTRQTNIPIHFGNWDIYGLIARSYHARLENQRLRTTCFRTLHCVVKGRSPLWQKSMGSPTKKPTNRKRKKQFQSLSESGLSSETKSDTAEVQPSVSVVGNPIHTSMTEQPEAKNTSKSSTDGKKMYIRATIYIISLFLF